MTKSFEEIVRSESPRVFRLLCRLLGRSEDLEDLAQEAFLRLFRAIPHFRGASKLETYLYRIVINVANDERRRLAHERQKITSLDDTNAEWHDRLPSRTEHPIHALMQLDFLAAVEHGLTAVSDAERTCLVLFYQEGRTYEQIAAVLGLPVGTVKTHLHRGRLRLKQQAQQFLAPRRKKEI